MWSSDLNSICQFCQFFLKAIEFVVDKHRDQRRKDAEAFPYINHAIAVATVLAAEGQISDETILIVAALHDTIEDTKITFAELEEQFGPEVTALVREVTDDKSLKSNGAEEPSGRPRSEVLQPCETS